MREGDLVKIKVPIIADTKMLWKYQCKVTTITKKQILFKNGSYTTAYIELKGCNSAWNIPYSFLSDWVTKEGI